MKILLCGAGNSAFRTNLISRLNKERHEVFLLSGNKNDSGKTDGAFQNYVFPYTDEGITSIMGNIGLDMLVFLGAMDTNFGAEWNKSQVVYYISGLTNVLLSAQNAGVKKFFYISTLDIYNDNKEDSIKEDTVPMPKKAREEAILQGEEICKFYQSEDFSTYILRVGNVYGGFGRDIISDKAVEPMVQKITEQQSIVCDSRKGYFMTDIADAVDGVCRLMFQTEQFSQVSTMPGINVSEETLVKELSEVMGKNIEITCTEEEERTRHFYFEKEDVYGFGLKYPLDEGLIRYMQHRSSLKKKTGKKKEKKKKNLELLRPFIETVVVFLVVLLIQTLGNGIDLLEIVDFYLLYVVLIAAIHGTNCCLIALLLSIFGKFAMDINAQGFEIMVLDYTKYLWVLQLLIAGVLVGYMRDKYLRKSQDMTDELAYCNQELENLKHINESNVYVKNTYEKRLINYRNSMARIYEITAQLDFMDSRRVAFKAVNVVKEVMECAEVSIYTRSGKSEYFRLMASNTGAYRNFGKTFRYDKEFEMYEMLEEDGVYRNRELKEKIPIMASAIKDSIGVQTIIMIWNLDLNYINQYQVNLFRVLSRLIEKTMIRANEYMENVYQNAYFSGTKVMKTESVENILDIYREGLEHGVFEYVRLKVEHKDERAAEWLAYLDQIQKMLREMDIVGIDGEGNGQIILAASNQDDAQFVMKRLTEKNIQAVYMEQ